VDQAQREERKAQGDDREEREASTPLEVMDQAAIAASKAGADGQRDGNVVIVP